MFSCRVINLYHTCDGNFPAAVFQHSTVSRMGKIRVCHVIRYNMQWEAGRLELEKGCVHHIR